MTRRRRYDDDIEIRGMRALRWVHRTRRVMAPPYAAGALWLLGVWAHHNGDWRTVLGIGALVGCTLGLTVHLVVRDLAQRVFYGSTILSSVSWVVAATIVGPWQRWMLWAWGGLACAHAVAWWSNRRVARRVEVDRMIEAWPDVASQVGLGGARMLRGGFRATGRGGWEALITGADAEDVVGRTRKIAAQMGLLRGRLTASYTERADVTRLVYEPEEAHPDGTKLTEPRVRSIQEPLEIGVRPNGSIVKLLIYRAGFGALHGLLAGATGSGKSNLIHLLISYIVKAEDALAWVIDLKGGGQEHAAWTRALDWLAVEQPAAVSMVGAVTRICAVRGRLSRKLWGSKVWRPSPEYPVICLIIDECAELLGDDDLQRSLKELKSIARTARSLGVFLLFATQLPTNEAIGSSQIKAQISWSICGRLKKAGQAQHVLSNYQDIDVSALPLDKPGTMYLEYGEEEPFRFRTHELDESGIEDLAMRYGQVQPLLDGDSVTAAGRPYLERDRDPLELLDEIERGQWFTSMAQAMADGDEVGDGVPDATYWKTLVVPRDGERMEDSMSDRVVSGRQDFDTADVFGDPEFPPVPDGPLSGLTAAPAEDGDVPAERAEPPADREAALMECLRGADPDGVSPKTLQAASGYSRATVHRRIEELLNAGRVQRVSEGRYVLVLTAAERA